MEKGTKRYKECHDAILEHWEKKFPQRIGQDQLKQIENILSLITDEDGLKRVTVMETGKTHLVPVEDMVRFGLHGSDLDKYPEAPDR